MDCKVILFDFDDTLVETIKPKWAQHKYVAKTYYNKELHEDEIRLHWGKPFSLLLKELYQTDKIEEATTYNIATRERFPKLLFPEMTNVIEELKRRGKVLGIVTATSTCSLDYDFASLNIKKSYFDYVQTQEDSQFHKPDPRVFEPTKAWLSEQGYTNSDVLYIGDALTDMKAAQEAGFNFIGTSTGLVSAKNFESLGVRALHSLSDLLT